VKLLLDQNLSPRLIQELSALYAESVHIRDIGLHRADDESVWSYAAEHAFTLVSKDSDFRQRSFLLGAPPKVIWIRRGNCSTDEILGLLRTHHAEILAFNEDSEATFLALG
jgi:predicted nuclease of predicted toxin-antitoxin system